jgi:hypothetical protein
MVLNEKLGGQAQHRDLIYSNFTIKRGNSQGREIKNP